MPELSSDLRDYVDALVASIDDDSTSELGLDPTPPHRSRRGAVVAAGAAAAAVLAVVMLVVGDDDPTGEVHTADEPTTTTQVTTFEDLEPGWHALDTGPVPPMPEASIAWTGTDLIVVGEDPGNGYRAFAYTPADATWRELPDMPDGQWPREGAPGLAWTGEELLVVERSARGAASWDPDTNTWEQIDPPSLAEPLQAVGPGMSANGPWGGPPALIWTGEAVLDLTHGAVWSPEDRTWRELAMPDDLIPYVGLAYTTPALVGDEVVAAPWSTAPGLAWNATGTSFRELPGMPPGLLAQDDATADALATGLDGRVYLISGTREGRTASLDPQTGTWRREPDLFDTLNPGCPTRVTTVADRIVARACGSEPSVVLGSHEDREWESIGGEADGCCDWANAEWIEADGVLLSWSTTLDAYNDPDGPHVRAAVWVPPEGPRSASGPPDSPPGSGPE